MSDLNKKKEQTLSNRLARFIQEYVQESSVIQNYYFFPRSIFMKQRWSGFKSLASEF